MTNYKRTLLLAMLLPASPIACASGPVTDLGPTLTLTDRGGSRPTTAIDPRNGTIYVAWVGTHAGSSNVYLVRHDPDAERPTEPIRVNHIPGDAAPHDQAPARVGVGPEGTIYIVWQNNTTVPGRRFPASNLRLARSTDRGETFTPAIDVNEDAAGPPASHTFHDLAIATTGEVLVSWIDSRESAHAEAGPAIRLASSNDGGHTFQPSQVVDRQPCPCCRTTIALASNGTAYLAWRKIFDGDIRDIVIARAEPPTLAETGVTSNSPPMAHGPVALAAERATPATPNVTGEIHPPVRPHHDEWRLDACPHAGPALMVDLSGEIHLAWYTGREDGAGLYYSSSSDQGATYSPPSPILVGKTVPPSQVALATTDRSTILIAWEDRRTAERRIHLARLSQGTLSGRALTLNGTAPALANAAGTTALAWLDGEAVYLRIAR
jgi:hypothetical protein